MANVPCTLLIKTLDPFKLPPIMLYVVCKEIFKYGLKACHINKQNQVVLNLAYSPKAHTLANKFGDMPIQYVRMCCEKNEEIALFQTALSIFKFNLQDEVHLPEQIMQIGSVNREIEQMAPPPALPPATRPRKNRKQEFQQQQQLQQK